MDVTAEGAPAATEAGAPHVERLSQRVDRLVGDRWRLADGALLVAAAIGAWVTRFIQDDAFITYRFARNAARGHGLVFNPGERVEGYTNFLWTALHIVPEELGWTTPVFSQVVGIALLLGTVALMLRFARVVLRSQALGYLAAVALVANVTFLGYGTGGLETMLQTLLVLGVVTLLLPVGAIRPERLVVRRVAAGVVGGLAVLTRMDSAVLVTTAVIVHLVVQHRSMQAAPAGEAGEAPGPSKAAVLVSSALQIGLPALVVVAPWLLWKLDFYGSVVPNTFHAKSAANPVVPFLFGILYLLCFFASYAAFLLIGRWRRSGRELFAVPGPAQVLALVPVWFLYICVVGADFMEFRFLVPVLPLLALVVAFLVDRFTSVRRHALLVGTLLAFSAAHAVAPTVLPYPVLTFKEISHWPSQSPTAWKAMGDLLARTFPGGIDEPDQPVVAVAPLGVISYYSDLPTIDMLGLTDEHVARHGDPVDLYYPGHVRMAPVSYLLERGVDLVIGQPRTVPLEEDRTGYRLSELVFLWPTSDLNELPDDATVVEVPLTPDTVWLWIRLQEDNDKVRAAIDENGWRELGIDRTCDPDDLGGTFERLAVGSATCPEER